MKKFAVNVFDRAKSFAFYAVANIGILAVGPGYVAHYIGSITTNFGYYFSEKGKM
jgi:hypothetical protein